MDEASGRSAQPESLSGPPTQDGARLTGLLVTILAVGVGALVTLVVVLVLLITGTIGAESTGKETDKEPVEVAETSDSPDGGDEAESDGGSTDQPDGGSEREPDADAIAGTLVDSGALDKEQAKCVAKFLVASDLSDAQLRAIANDDQTALDEEDITTITGVLTDGLVECAAR